MKSERVLILFFLSFLERDIDVCVLSSFRSSHLLSSIETNGWLRLQSSLIAFTLPFTNFHSELDFRGRIFLSSLYSYSLNLSLWLQLLLFTYLQLQLQFRECF